VDTNTPGGVARVFWLNQVLVNENVGLNHPISDAVGAAQRAQPIRHALSVFSIVVSLTPATRSMDIHYAARAEEERRELTKLSHQDNLVFDSARGAPEDFKSVSLAGEG